MRRPSKPKSRLFSRLAGFSFCMIGLAFFYTAGEEIRANALMTASDETIESLLTKTISRGHSASYYERLGVRAIQRQKYAEAQLATIQLLKLEPKNVSAWNRLAFIDVAEDSRLSKAGVSYLEKSYQLAPYGTLELMTWRTDFASQIWPSLPQSIRQKTMQQLPVIAQQGTSWEWRIRHCRENPNEEVARAICQYAPGVVRAPRS